MRRAILAFAAVLVAVPAFALEGEKPEWYACKVDADCVVAEQVCGQMTSVNVAAVEAYKAAVNHEQSMIKCRWSTVTNSDQLKAVCVSAKCALSPAPVYGRGS